MISNPRNLTHHDHLVEFPDVEELGMMDAAFRWVERGYSVIPLRPLKKTPAINTWKEFQSRLPTRNEIINWWNPAAGYQNRNIGLVTGRFNNLTVLDIDGKKSPDQKDGWTYLKEKGFAKPDPSKVPYFKTPHGMHLCYDFDPDVPNRDRYLGYPNVDARSEGGYIVAPPSIVMCQRLEEGKYCPNKDTHQNTQLLYRRITK